MKFVQRELGETAEASAKQDHHLIEAAQLSAIVLGILAVIYLATGFVTDAVVARMSPQTEARLFGGFEFLQKGHSGDAEKWKPLLERLVAHPSVPKIPYRVSVIENEEPNALALPGGTIGLTRGLITMIGDNQPAMAFVLGHELGHFAQRDHLRGLGRGIGLAVCMALVTGGAPGAESLANLTSAVFTRNFSRTQEEGADQFGTRVVFDTLGTVEGAEHLFQLMDELESMPRWAYMLSTHPDPESRIQAIRNEIDRLQRERP